MATDVYGRPVGIHVWTPASKLSDGTQVYNSPYWGDGVYEPESCLIISPVAYSCRKELRVRGIKPFGDHG